LQIVCLHGLARSARDWDGVRAELELHGTVLTPEVAPDDLPDSTVLVGHSMAGVAALRLAADERVAGVILTGSFFPPARNGRSTAQTLRGYGRHRLAVVRDLVSRGRTPRPSGVGARGLGSLARLGLWPSAFHAVAGAVQAPVLVIHASDDHYVPIDFALAAAARHPAWEVSVLAAGGHNAHVDRPADWMAAAEPWLTRLAAC
jgi:pimeloyl-ACP methyl ester carboxylesterase